VTLNFPNQWFYIPVPNDSTNQVFLDGVYSGITDIPGWAVLLTDGASPQILHVTEARQVSKAAYTLSAKTTRLTFGQSENVQQNTFPLRSTTILTASEQLVLQNNLAVPDPVSGTTLLLAGIHSQLRDGQTAVIQGNLFDSTANLPTGTSAAESAILSGAPVLDSANNLTQVTLKEPLSNGYVVATCSLLGNVVEVTQGETIKDEVLGSGDGTAFQSYPLKQGPLTYLPSTDPESGSAVQSTLLVSVNGVLWTEEPTLAGSAPHDQAFTTTLDSSGKATVVFGDGFDGARPASGINNVHARYRKGLGTSGNLPSGALQQLVDSLPGVQKVTNPLPSAGGGDPDNIAQIRLRAPASLRTFGRAISAPDHAALALSYPGIGKASAAWITQDPVTMVSLARPYVQLTVAAVNGSAIQGTVFANKLRLFLDQHRDPNIPLRVQDFISVLIQVAVEVDIDSRAPQQATLSRVQAALNPGLNPDGSFGFFAFDRLDFGQSIYLSALYAVLQAIPGVDDVTVMALRRAAEPLSTVPHDIVIRPAEIVVIDPTPGSLAVTGQGGFRDT
jgi:predicted phage baseplate assembly protein